MYCFYEGIGIDDKGKIVFNYDTDYVQDVLYLVNDNSGITTIRNSIEVFYAFNYNKTSSFENRKKVREYLKRYSNTDDVKELVETAVFRFDKLFNINSFGACVSIDSSNKLVEEMEYQLIGNYPDTLQPTSFKLVKQLYNSVIFDREKLFRIYKNHGYSISKCNYLCDKAESRFNEAKTNNELFKMKNIKSAYTREVYSNFLKFKNESDEELYKTIENYNVLIYDDFLTSEQTLFEMNNYLRSINLSNRIVAFVLVDQKVWNINKAGDIGHE